MKQESLYEIADTCTAADTAEFEPETLRTLARIHRGRGELLSALQYEELAEDKEENVWVGFRPDKIEALAQRLEEEE